MGETKARTTHLEQIVGPLAVLPAVIQALRSDVKEFVGSYERDQERNEDGNVGERRQKETLNSMDWQVKLYAVFASLGFLIGAGSLVTAIYAVLTR